MLLHDSYFFSLNKSLNQTHYTSIVAAHSPLFHSTLTLFLSIFGVCANFLCMIYLSIIHTQSKQDNRDSNHILSNNKYRFLILLTSNDFFLCLSSIISCIDEKYYSQSLIAQYHLCSYHILLWKFTLHFTPILTIFILLRYYYMLNKNFPMKIYTTTTLDQFFCTDLCILISFVIALAWSVDGLWLWGETNLTTFITPSTSSSSIDSDHIQSTTISNNQINTIQSNISSSNHIPFSEQKLICYLQTNNNIEFTARLLYLIQADFFLLFFLHCLGFFLEILLHIRLSCCLMARKMTPLLLREQQLALYVLYLFVCLTITSLPFYFYRTLDMFLDVPILTNHYDIINSRILAQIILFGLSFKPILYVLLLMPISILLKFKCYTSIQMETYDKNDIYQEKKIRVQRSEIDRYSLKLPLVKPKTYFNLRRLSTPILTTPILHQPVDV